MANKALTMLQIRRCLMLFQEASSIREIHRSTGIHRTTIKAYMERCKNSGKTFEELLALADHDLSALLHPPRNTQQADERYLYLSGRLEHYAKELKRRHVTKLILWEEYPWSQRPACFVKTQLFYPNHRFPSLCKDATARGKPSISTSAKPI